MSEEHYCRICNCYLTIDNIYPGHIRKHNWICKKCDNKRRRSKKTNQKSKDPVQYISRSCANYIRTSNPPSTSSCCYTCAAYNQPDSTCHLNPPPWHKVDQSDWCKQYIHK